MHADPIAASSRSTGAPVRRPPRRELVVGAICLMGVVMVGVAGALIRGTTGVSVAEEHVLVWINGLRNPVLDGIALFLQVVFAPLGAVIITVSVSVAAGLLKSTAAAGIKAAVLIGAPCLVAWLLKVMIARPRPDSGLLPDPLFHIGGATSFPSGHTVFAMALALFPAMEVAHRRIVRVVCVLAIALIVIVALSRLYLGVHYPSDVLASLVLAAAVFFLARAIWILIGFTRRNRFHPGV